MLPNSEVDSLLNVYSLAFNIWKKKKIQIIKFSIFFNFTFHQLIDYFGCTTQIDSK